MFNRPVPNSYGKSPEIREILEYLNYLREQLRLLEEKERQRK